MYVANFIVIVGGQNMEPYVEYRPRGLDLGDMLGDEATATINCNLRDVGMI
jgi:hypothetical protein